MSIDKKFWKNKSVFITGATGFKGSWLCLWLNSLGANVYGLSRDISTKANLFNMCKLHSDVNLLKGDVSSKDSLLEALIIAKPEVIIHMAAQPFVGLSYDEPVKTYEINMMGTVNLLEAVRIAVHRNIPVKALINVTTDRCYEDKDWVWGYREEDALGGLDPYSNSKACSEFVTMSYRNSFFNPEEYDSHGVGIASARPGNIIGGGDFGKDRLIPDVVRAISTGTTVKIKNPLATRPWQFVLEPLEGYLLLAQKLVENGRRYSCSWNFCPNEQNAKSVEWIVQQLCERWGDGASYITEKIVQSDGGNYVRGDSSRAKNELCWNPNWSINQSLDSIVEFTRAHQGNLDLRSLCLTQLDRYCETV
ncbi:CDP-glucose 4,6-dehydratase [Bacillus haimaensis]|uniref:CDP-glucose 4,6-dehydratase n=1 Tax=Bacillus haimaensis TaxID=3160967 RepID=UPI003AA82FAB